MTTYHLVSLAFAAIFVALLVRERDRWLTFSCVGVFTIFNLLMVQTGVMLTVWGYKWRTYHRMADVVPKMTDRQILEVVLISGLGFLSVWLGIVLFERVAGRPEIRSARTVMSISANTPTGIRIAIFWILSGLAVLAFVVAFSPLADDFLAVAGRSSRNSQLFYRLGATAGSPHYGLTQIGYNLLPYLAVCGLVLFLTTRQWRYLALLPWALLGKVVYLHKRPLALFLLHLGLVVALIGSTRSEFRSRTVTTAGIVILPVLAFLSLPVLWILFTGGELSLANLMQSSQGVVERFVGRISNSYFYVAYFFPDHYPYHGPRAIKGLSRLLGLQHVPINKEIFLLINSQAVRLPGSVPFDNITHLYQAYALRGVVLGGLLQGALLAGVDHLLSRYSRTLGDFVLYSFLVILLGATLNQSHIFSLGLGYGGALFVVLWLLLRTSTGDVSTPNEGG